jgi:ABC-type bacteriocin/lantibiotic exporter with double-glycine peptidase domain
MGQSIGLMVLTTIMVGRLQGVMSEIFRTVRDMQTIGDSLTALGLFMSITDGPPRSRDFTGQTISRFEIKNLSFSYPNASVFEKSFVDILINRLKKLKSPHHWDIEHLEKYQDLKRELEVTHPFVLKDISLQFEANKIYGIVGKNGVGKTTLTEIILGYYSNFSGSILAD